MSSRPRDQPRYQIALVTDYIINRIHQSENELERPGLFCTKRYEQAWHYM
jgi:hypothetical protein